jgi:hypothetical protein
MPEAPIVCWDFDETLGYFRPLEFRYLGEETPLGMPPVRLKPGIRDLLVSMGEFTHVVTTAAIGEYAREVLREHGLLNAFAAVFGREDGVFPADGKDYKVVGAHFGIDDADLCRRLVIVGNDPKRDPDIRYRQIVMIYDDKMVDRPSEPVGAVLRRLLAEGQTDMKRGFDRLLQSARQGSVQLPEGVQFDLDYWGSYAENKLHPMIISPRPLAA